LAKYRDVECDSSERADATPVMVVGLMLYVVGIYFMFAYATWVAPTMMTDRGFCERWKFLLARWRPATWYWGLVLMGRNLLVSFARLVASECEAQLTYLVAVVLIVFSLVAVWQPWRANVLNHYDIISSIVLCFVGLFGLVFISLSEQMTLYERLELPGLAAQLGEVRYSFGIGLFVLCVAFVAGFLGIVVWCCSTFLPGRMAVVASAHERKCKVQYKRLADYVSQPGFLDECQRVINTSTDYDRRCLREFLNKFGEDFLTAKAEKAAKPVEKPVQVICA